MIMPQTRGMNGDARWQAVLNRDAAADGAFVFAVKTTGVYCRPSCRSRRANRENIEYFSSSATAEAAGYRACRRCRPDMTQPYRSVTAAIADACRIIENSRVPLSVSTLARAVDMSPSNFHRQFKAVTGVPPRAFAAAQRDSRVRAALMDGKPISSAIAEAGFRSTTRFYTSARAALGMAPAKARRRGSGLTIYYATDTSALGLVLVAATDQGICAIELGDSRAALLRSLRGRFSEAKIVKAGTWLLDRVQAVLRTIEEPRRSLELPLDLRGTAFEIRVWQALRAIPVGETTTYSNLARRIGNPSAARAVARACAANKLAVAVPCHRVVRSDGAMGGYRWGVNRKKALLDRERSP